MKDSDAAADRRTPLQSSKRDPLPAWLEKVRDLAEGMDFGELVIVVQNGKPIRVKETHQHQV